MAEIIVASGETELPGLRELRDAGAIARAMQTGSAMLVAEYAGEVAGAVRTWDEEGTGWFDLLVARRPGAGRVLVRAVGSRAQDRGLRFARCLSPSEAPFLDYFSALGYLPVAVYEGATEGEDELYVLERRLPLLTVRDQRREDAEYIARVTGRDSYPFEMGHRPGWFVAADGDRRVGVAAVLDAGGGRATGFAPVLEDVYRGRGLELWMLERLAYHAEHAGYFEVRIELDDWLKGQERDLEDRGWFRDGDVVVRRAGAHASDERDLDWPPEEPDAPGYWDGDDDRREDA